MVSTLTWVHLAYLLYEGLIKSCYYGATYWNHEVLVQALYKGIDSSHTSSLMKHRPIKRVINHSNDSKHFDIIHLSSELSFCSSFNMQLLHKWRQVQVFYKWHGSTYLLYEVHAFGRLHSVCIVNDVGNVIFGTHSGQLLKPTSQDNS